MAEDIAIAHDLFAVAEAGVSNTRSAVADASAELPGTGLIPVEMPARPKPGGGKAVSSTSTGTRGTTSINHPTAARGDKGCLHKYG